MVFSVFRKSLTSLLVEEFETYIPQFKPYTLDYQMVVYACRDLETWLKAKWQIDDNRVLYEKIEEFLNKKPQDFKAFLNFWIGLWLKKWRERVKVLSTKPNVPPFYLEKIKKAKKLCGEMEHRRELKKMVVKKLVGQNEICMTEEIADTLIIQEVEKRLGTADEESDFTKLVILDPLDILNALSHRISRLPKEKGPLIYVNIKQYTI